MKNKYKQCAKVLKGYLGLYQLRKVTIIGSDHKVYFDGAPEKFLYKNEEDPCWMRWADAVRKAPVEDKTVNGMNMYLFLADGFSADYDDFR